LTGPAGAAVHYHGDHLGGVALLTAPDGSVAGEVSYDPWGAQLAGSTEPYAFTGKEYEADVGLYDFGARIYDAGIGRFLSPDPEPLSNPGYGLSDPQRLNPYSYVRNSPTVYVDPTGKYLESPLDAAFVIIDIASYVYHTVKGDTRAAQIDTLAFIADMACLATPVATGGGLLVRGGARSEQILLHAGTKQSGQALIKAEQVGARGQTAAAGGPIWSATKGKTSVENAFGHWKKHGAEFPEFQNAKQYTEGARRFLNEPPRGALTKARPNGETIVYDPATNAFGVRAADGAPKTMFRPDPAKHAYPTNLDYFNAQ
jgi:RHS repeat-associated protein